MAADGLATQGARPSAGIILYMQDRRASFTRPVVDQRDCIDPVCMGTLHISVTNHWHFNCVFNSLFRLTTKKTPAPHYWPFVETLHWRYMSVTNHRQLDCVFNSLFRLTTKKTPKWPVVRNAFPFDNVIITLPQRSDHRTCFVCWTNQQIFNVVHDIRRQVTGGKSASYTAPEDCPLAPTCLSWKDKSFQRSQPGIDQWGSITTLRPE